MHHAVEGAGIHFAAHALSQIYHDASDACVFSTKPQRVRTSVVHTHTLHPVQSPTCATRHGAAWHGMSRGMQTYIYIYIIYIYIIYIYIYIYRERERCVV